ncbi:MAG: hypothetical protein ACLQFR_30335 [Streptosporangiaceae bacterium]
MTSDPDAGDFSQGSLGELLPLIDRAVDLPEITGALDALRMSRGELERQIRATLDAHVAAIWESAEPERQAAQLAESRIAVRLAEIQAENETLTRNFLARSARRYALPVLLAIILVALGVAESLSVWARTGLGLAGLIILAAAGIISSRGLLKLQRHLRAQRSNLTSEVELARQAYDAAIMERGILPYIRQIMNDPEIRKAYYDVSFNVRSAPGLEGDDSEFIIETTGTRALVDKLNAMPRGGSIGVAGPRGCGKTTTLTAINSGRIHLRGRARSSPQTFRIMVTAPVEFVSREFLLHLFATICETYIEPFTNLADLPVDDSPPRRIRRTMIKQSGILGVLLIIASAVALFLALPPATRSLFWHKKVLPFMAKTLGKHWRGTRADTDSVLHFLGRLGTRAEEIGLTLLVLGLVLLEASRRRWVANTRSRRRSELRRRDLGVHAQRLLRRIRFQQSYSSGWSGTLTLPILEGGVTEAMSLAENQMSLPDIVASIKDFLGQIAANRKVIVVIDELDKIDSNVKAWQFLNDLKGIFGVPDCFYLVSISEEALSSFELRGLPFRDAFDSAFDEVARMRYLTYTESRNLLQRRVIGLSAAYIGLCHCLSAGLPRDLMRVVRDLWALQKKLTPNAAGAAGISWPVLAGEKASLAAVAGYLVRDDLQDRIAAIDIALRDVAGSLEFRDLATWIDGVRMRLSLSTKILAADLLALSASYLTDVRRDPARAKFGQVELRADRLGLGLLGSLYYSATLLEFFTDLRDEAELRIFEGDGSGSAEQLALARQAFGSSVLLAWPRISSFRNAWHMSEVLDPPI